jgi:hypothetical protein
MSDVNSNDTTQTDEAATTELDPIARREIMTKLVAVAALAATGLVSGEANAEVKAASALKLDKVDKVDKVDKWNESYKVFKDSAIKFVKLRTGFRVEIHATPELGTTLRSMGLVPAAGDASAVKLSIEFSNS